MLLGKHTGTGWFYMMVVCNYKYSCIPELQWKTVSEARAGEE